MRPVVSEGRKKKEMPMTRFIQQSACEGRRPHGVVPDRLRSRPRLLSRLLEDRGALRLVVAPPGFGKATLAFEYASVMFQFEHVFWLRGSSPCFLRDLDAGVLAEAVLEADEHAALMVVTDLPLLTDDRAEAFAEVVERLADANCEVIATTTRADAPMELFGRRVVIGAAEMLVAREDLEEEPEGVTDRRPLGLAERIARPAMGVCDADPAGARREPGGMHSGGGACPVGHDGARKGHDRRRARAARGAPGREGLGCSRRALPSCGHFRRRRELRRAFRVSWGGEGSRAGASPGARRDLRVRR